MATSKKKLSRYGDFFLNLENAFVGFASPFFCRQVVKIRPKKIH
jgi:hypothetical protein